MPATAAEVPRDRPSLAKNVTHFLGGGVSRVLIWARQLLTKNPTDTRKHTPCLLASPLLQAMWRNQRKKHNPHPARNSLLRKAGEKRGGVKCVFYSFSLTRLS
jgi:hypothetical protein